MKWSIVRDEDNHYCLSVDNVQMTVGGIVYFQNIQELIETVSSSEVQPAFEAHSIMNGNSIEELLALPKTHPELFI